MVKTASQNGAPPEVIQKILQSPDLATAYKNAGNFMMGGTGTTGLYNYYLSKGGTKTIDEFLKATGEFNLELLAKFDEAFLADVGFNSEELDEIFNIDIEPEQFDLQKELHKLKIEKIEIKKGDVWQLGSSRMMCGDSTIENDMLKLMGNKKADMCLTDPPYILDYLKGKKKNGKPTKQNNSATILKNG